MLYSEKGSLEHTWSPHGSMTKSVKISGDRVLSAGDTVCVFDRKSQASY